MDGFVIQINISNHTFYIKLISKIENHETHLMKTRQRSIIQYFILCEEPPFFVKDLDSTAGLFVVSVFSSPIVTTSS